MVSARATGKWIQLFLFNPVLPITNDLELYDATVPEHRNLMHPLFADADCNLMGLTTNRGIAERIPPMVFGQPQRVLPVPLNGENRVQPRRERIESCNTIHVRLPCWPANGVEIYMLICLVFESPTVEWVSAFQSHGHARISTWLAIL